MKRLFQAMVLLSMATIIGCSDDEDGVEVHAIAVTPESVELATGAQSFTVKVEHDGEVEISIPGDAQWLSGGGKTLAVSADTCTFSVTANDEVEARSAIITFTDKDYNLSDTLRVTQSGTAPEIAVSNPKVELAAADTTFSVEVKHNVEVEVAISEEAAWLTQVETETRAMTTNTYTFNAAENPDTTARKATITFANTANGLSQTVEVTQEGRELEDITEKILDPIFKKYCLDKYDSNKDGKITEDEVADVTEMGVQGEGIQSLKGIEYFTGLETLDCSGNHLTSLDVSKNTALTILDCMSNKQLDSLDVSKNTKLTQLTCSFNNLTSLDVSKNTALTLLICGFNPLMSIDVKQNTELTKLSCGSNQLTNLDVSENTKLTFLACASNQLTSLDVSKNMELTYLNCGNNQLTNLDVKNNTKLDTLDCYNNQLTNLDVSSKEALTLLWCHGNNLVSLSVSGCTALTTLKCGSNKLTSLDVSNCGELKELNCYDNELNSLNVLNTKLIDLTTSFNNLTSLDIENNELTSLDCSYNQLTSLNVSSPALTSLKCHGNLLNSLDVSKTNLVEGKGYPLDCAPMNDKNRENTLKTLILKRGWKIKGINNPSNKNYIPEETEIMEVD